MGDQNYSIEFVVSFPTIYHYVVCDDGKVPAKIVLLYGGKSSYGLGPCNLRLQFAISYGYSFSVQLSIFFREVIKKLTLFNIKICFFRPVSGDFSLFFRLRRGAIYGVLR